MDVDNLVVDKRVVDNPVVDNPVVDNPVVDNPVDSLEMPLLVAYNLHSYIKSMSSSSSIFGPAVTVATAIDIGVTIAILVIVAITIIHFVIRGSFLDNCHRAARDHVTELDAGVH